MWAAEAWAKQQPNEPKCWDQSRDQYGLKNQTSDVFFNDILHGTMCESNWYEVSLRPCISLATFRAPQISREASSELISPSNAARSARYHSYAKQTRLAARNEPRS